MKIKKRLLIALFTCAVFVTALMTGAVFAEEAQSNSPVSVENKVEKEAVQTSTLKLKDIKAYDKTAFVEINDNVPDFYISQITTNPYVSFSPLDKLGRTGACIACLSKETLPTESREQVSGVDPSGWNNKRYDQLIEGQYLFNRSHVIAYQLCGDNGSPENLITGTDYLNTNGMHFFEDMVAAYLEKNKDHHVIYRVTPFYDGDNLVPMGVQMEAFSVEDYGKDLCFNVFVYNVQPGIEINYKNGDSKEDPNYVPGSEIKAAEAYGKISVPEIVAFSMLASETTDSENGLVNKSVSEDAIANPETEEETAQTVTYILNTNTHKFHTPTCSSVADMKEKNKQEFYGSFDEAVSLGYKPCQKCLN